MMLAVATAVQLVLVYPIILAHVPAAAAAVEMV